MPPVSGEERSVTERQLSPTDKITITPSANQTAAEVEADLDRHEAFVTGLRSRGVQEWHSTSTRRGPVKVMRAKEVGPPAWRFPRIQVGLSRRSVTISAGWRMTAYRLIVLRGPRG